MCEYLEKYNLGDCILINIHCTSYFEPRDFGPYVKKEGWASTMSSVLVSTSPFMELGELADLHSMAATLRAFTDLESKRFVDRVIVYTENKHIYRGIAKIVAGWEAGKDFS